VTILASSRKCLLVVGFGEGDLARARRLVNGGSYGLDRFADAFKRGPLAVGGAA
jgi:predicted chitinase